MAISRYEKSNIVIDEELKTPRLSTFPNIRAEDLTNSEDTIQIRFTDGMRIDSLAAEYLGDGRYWWMICIANNLPLPFGNNITPGKILVIPTDPNKILRLLAERENQI